MDWKTACQGNFDITGCVEAFGNNVTLFRLADEVFEVHAHNSFYLSGVKKEIQTAQFKPHVGYRPRSRPPKGGFNPHNPPARFFNSSSNAFWGFDITVAGSLREIREGGAL